MEADFVHVCALAVLSGAKGLGIFAPFAHFSPLSQKSPKFRHFRYILPNLAVNTYDGFLFSNPKTSCNFVTL